MRPGRLAFVLAACALAASVAWVLRAPVPGGVAGIELDAGRAERADATSAGLLGGDAGRSVAELAPNIGAAADRATARTPATASPARDDSGRSILAHASLRALVLRDEDGTPFAGARVTLRAPGGGRRKAFEFREDLDPSRLSAPPSVLADAAGAVQFDGLESGNWTVIADAPGYGATEAEVRIRRTESGPEVVLRVAVQREIRVRLVDPAGRDLEPEDCGLDAETVPHVDLAIAGACWRPEPLAPVGGARADEVEREAPFRWRVVLRGRAPACAHVRLGGAIVAAEPLAAGTTELALRVRPSAFADLLAPVVVRVVSEPDDAPVRDALVTVHGGERRDASRRTDEDGRASLAPRFDGRSEVVVLVPGFATARLPLRCPVEGELVVRVTAGRLIGGVLRGADGAPAARATIALHEVAADGAVAVDGARLVKTSREGRFRFEDVAPGAYAVGVQGAPRASAKALPDGFRLVDCAADDALDVELVRAPIAVKTRRAPR